MTDTSKLMPGEYYWVKKTQDSKYIVGRFHAFYDGYFETFDGPCPVWHEVYCDESGNPIPIKPPSK